MHIKSFFLTLCLFIIYFHTITYGDQKNQKRITCHEALMQFQEVYSQPSHKIQLPYTNTNHLISALKQIWGSFHWEDIKFLTVSELVYDMYNDPQKYNLIFYGIDRIDRSKFNFLNSSSRVIQIKNNQKTVFYIHSINRLSFVIYFVQDTPYGQVLSYVDSPTKTGILIKWFEQKINHLDWSLNHVNPTLLEKSREENIILYDIVKTMNQDDNSLTVRSPTPQSLLKEIKKNFSSIDISQWFIDTMKFKSGYAKFNHSQDSDSSQQASVLKRSIQLTAFLMRITSIIHPLKQKTPILLDLPFKDKNKSKSQYHKLALTTFTGLNEEQLMDLSKDFKELFHHSLYGTFLRRVLVISGLLNRIESLKPPDQQKDSYKQNLNTPLSERFHSILNKASSVYQKAKRRNTKVKFNYMRSFQNVYLIRMIKDQTDQGSLLDSSPTEGHPDDIFDSLIEKENFIQGQVFIELQDIYWRTRWDLFNTLIYRGYDYAGILFMMAEMSPHISEKTLIDAFFMINQETHNPEITLMLLRGLLVGSSQDDLIGLYHFIKSFFNGKHLSSLSLRNRVKLFTSGFVVGMPLAQMASIIKSFSAYLHNVDQDTLTYFIDSAVNLYGMPYRMIKQSDGTQRAMTRDKDGHLQADSTAKIRDYIFRQIIYWVYLDDI